MIDFALSMKKIPNTMRQVPISQQKTSYSWQPPPTDFLKLNVDGAMFYDQHKAGVGIILLDTKGGYCDGN